MRTTFIGALCALGLGLAPTGAQATEKGGVQIGTLRCDVERGFGFIFGSTRDVHCMFEGVGGSMQEEYEGRIVRFGADIGYLASAVMIWSVVTPTGDLGDAALAGDYLGPSVQASAVLGTGANILLGGSQKSVSLQPLSIEGTTGLNVAGGITELRLDPPKDI